MIKNWGRGRSMPNIYILPNGTITGLYHDIIQEANLGVLKVWRASNIEFNILSQQWEVEIIGEGKIASFWTRKEALEWEVKYLENKIESKC